MVIGEILISNSPKFYEIAPTKRVLNLNFLSIFGTGQLIWDKQKRKLGL